MRKRNWAKVVLVIAVLSAIVAGVEAGFYISRASEDVIDEVRGIGEVSFIIRNIVTCFAFSPSLSISDVFNHMQDVEETGAYQSVYQWFTVAYAIVIVVAPICTASAFYVFFGDMLRFMWSRVRVIFMKKPTERILLIGTNRAANSIIDHEVNADRTREIIYITRLSAKDTNVS